MTDDLVEPIPGVAPARTRHPATGYLLYLVAALLFSINGTVAKSLLLAGFESLPQDVYEAARVDGVTPLSELRYITLPLMLPTIMVVLGFRLILAFKVFDEIYLLTGGGPGTATEVLSFTVYRRFFTQDRAGYGAAMSLFAMVLIAILAIAAMAAARRRQAQS